jgi:hypothetical protein
MQLRLKGRKKKQYNRSPRSSMEYALSPAQHHKAIECKCRMRCKAQHINHNVVWCITLVPYEYINRHNKRACYIHWTICKHTRLQITDKYYEHTSARVITVKRTTVGHTGYHRSNNTLKPTWYSAVAMAIIKHTYISQHFCPILTKFHFYWHIFVSVSNINFFRNPSNVSHSDKCRQTEGPCQN